MTKLAKMILLFGFVAFVQACAATIAVPVDRDDRTTRGIRYAESKPILVVSADAAEIQFIPNRDRQYAVKFIAFLAKNKSSLQLTNDTLTKVDVDLDNTKIIELLSSALNKIAPDAKADNAGQEAFDGQVVGIYDFVFDGKGNLTELKKIPLT